jgi:glycosyltransferase involved in cell wall biosynthesis
LKVGIFLTDIPPTEGGGFSYTEKLIQGIDQYKFDPNIQICFTGRLPKENIRLRREYIQLSSPSSYSFFAKLGKLGLTKFFSRLFKININRANENDHAVLKRGGVDIVFYVKHLFSEVDNFPFISMNWDIGHKSTFAFPETTGGQHFDYRQHWYTHELQKAFAVFVESEHGKRELSQYFAIPELKISVIPLFPGNVADVKVDEATQQHLLNKYNLKPGDYFYYPAQFWAHKNHYNLLEAFKRLVDEQPANDLKLVFTGSDQGNKTYVQSLIKSNNLEKRVVLLGFLDKEEVYTLYRNAIALVMPTYLGPTNMPLLEAQAIGVPVICSDFDGHREICGDGALYVDPASEMEIRVAMRAVLNANRRNELLQKSKEVFAKTIFTLSHALTALNDAFVKLSPVRKTFP